jgi:hypothetical protein
MSRAARGWAIAALAASIGAPAAAAQDLRIDYPKMSIRVPQPGAADKARAWAVAASVYLPEDLSDRAVRFEGEIRGRLFEALAKAYYAMPATGAAGLDLRILEERIGAEIQAITGAPRIRVVFREFSVR